MPWFLLSDEELNSFGVIRTPYDWRLRTAKEKREKVFADDELKARQTDEESGHHEVLDGVRTLLTNVNRPNEGQISYLPKGRVVESNGIIGEDSIRPLVASDPPLSVQSMVRRVSDEQQMTLDAVIANDDELLFKAFLSDPLMHIGRKEARKLLTKCLSLRRSGTKTETIGSFEAPGGFVFLYFYDPIAYVGYAYADIFLYNCLEERWAQR